MAWFTEESATGMKWNVLYKGASVIEGTGVGSFIHALIISTILTTASKYGRTGESYEQRF